MGLCIKSAKNTHGAMAKENTSMTTQDQKIQFVCPRLFARITIMGTRMLRLKNVFLFFQRTRASSTFLMKFTRAKKALIFLLAKTASGAIQHKSVQDMLIIKVNVSYEKLVTSTIKKTSKETNV